MFHVSTRSDLKTNETIRGKVQSETRFVKLASDPNLFLKRRIYYNTTLLLKTLHYYGVVAIHIKWIT